MSLIVLQSYYVDGETQYGVFSLVNFTFDLLQDLVPLAR
jgi:hypothetical protein